jgi:4-hydroxy-tetrahydrodipicolinate synthase
MNKIEGVFTALTTPFTEEGKLNEEILRSLIRFQIASKVQGIVVLGTTGEAPTLTYDEQHRIIEIAREEIPRNIHLLAGTGAYSTATTIKNTQLAQSLGADGALIVSPYYNKPTQEGLYQHYKAIAKSVDIPILIYNIQGRTAVNIQTDTLMRIAELPNIGGIKEASGNIQQISEVIEKIGRKSDFSVMCGDDSLTLPSISLGAKGIVSVLSNLIPLQIGSLTQAALKGNYDFARELHHSLMPLCRMAFIETNPIPMKAAMNFCGMDVGPCRLPLCPLSPENEKKLLALLQTHPISQYIQENLNYLEPVLQGK